MQTVLDILLTRSGADSFINTMPGMLNDLICAERLRDRGSRVAIMRTFSDIAISALGADFTIDTTGAVANDTLTLTTAASTNDTSGISTLVVNQYRANEPFMETRIKLAAVASAKLLVGYYKDSNEFAEILFDPSVSPNFYLSVNGGGTTQSLDLGVPVALGTYYKLGVGVNTDGTAFCTINDVLYTGSKAISNKMSADPHYARIQVTAQANVAQVATVKYIELTWNK
jgi:hypothetical protein